MITDNPGLKSDLQEYFENSKREGKEVKRKITSKPLFVRINFFIWGRSDEMKMKIILKSAACTNHMVNYRSALWFVSFHASH